MSKIARLFLVMDDGTELHFDTTRVREIANIGKDYRTDCTLLRITLEVYDDAWKTPPTIDNGNGGAHT